MEIATELTEQQKQKIAFIQQETRQNLDQILESALDIYYKQVLSASNNHLQKFSEIGFIGCIEAEPDLAERSESIL